MIFAILGFYKNKLLTHVYNGDSLSTYIFDIDTMEWKKTEIKYNGEMVTAGTLTIKSVGKYILFSNMIYDMENEEVVYYNNELLSYNYDKHEYEGYDFAKTYYGGKYNIELKDNKWYFIRFPYKGSNVIYDDFNIFEIAEDLSDEHNKVTALSEKYYKVENKDGTCFRTYEGGKDSEVWLWHHSE